MLALITIFLLLQEPTPPRESLEIQYYDVAGGTARELLASVEAKGPRGKAGRGLAGYTRWFVSWTYQYDCPASCAVTEVGTNVQIVITLPRWVPPAQAPPELRAQWERFVAALRVHEEGHADIGREARDAVRSRILAVGEFSDRTGLASAVQRAGNEIVAEYSRRDVSYDLRTAHGLAQGGALP